MIGVARMVTTRFFSASVVVVTIQITMGIHICVPIRRGNNSWHCTDRNCQGKLRCGQTRNKSKWQCDWKAEEEVHCIAEDQKSQF